MGQVSILNSNSIVNFYETISRQNKHDSSFDKHTFQFCHQQLLLAFFFSFYYNNYNWISWNLILILFSLTCIANSSSFPIFMCRFWSCHYFVWLAVVWCDTFAFYWRFICNTHGLGVAKEVSSYKTMWAFFQVMDFIFVFHSSSTNRLYCTIHISYSGWSSHSISWISLIRVIL